LIAFLFLAIGLLIGWMLAFRPLIRPVTSRRFDSTPQRLERGRYIVENLAGCLRCHSPNNLRKPVAGTEGSGYALPVRSRAPLKHLIVAPNITPDRDTGIGLWTDDEIGRAIREGVGRNGRSFGYAMPCLEYKKMTDEDLASVVVYVKTLAPVRNALPETKMVFPVQFLVRLVPEPITSVITADATSAEKRGAYLVALATCNGCHSPHDATGHLIEGLELSGGDVQTADPVPATDSNITPDQTGIQSTTAESFRKKMREGQTPHTVMPYDQYANLTDADLNDMYAYLRSIKPIRHVVKIAAAPTQCRLCKSQHGGGDQN
jgi:mono/diheme cytochrome c family protein